MRYYLVAGEASGDLHGSNLMKALKLRDKNADFRFWGGDLMAAEGGTLVSHYKNRAFMGLWEVLTHLRSIAAFLKQAEKDILKHKPDALILIDNPGFNLRLAAFAKNNGIPVHYYIAPKVWAWNEKRVNKIRKYVDHLYCILPFEPDFFKQHNITCHYVGNPVIDAVTAYNKTDNWKEFHGFSKPLIALLPGSRKNEIDRILPIMIRVAEHFPDCEFALTAAPDFDDGYFGKFGFPPNCKIVFRDTYGVLSNSTAAIVASGTATLETALFGVPQVVGYRVAWITYFIGKMVVKLKWFGLVNLILNRGLLVELLQNEFSVNHATAELRAILDGPQRREILNGYEELKKILGPAGASEKVAVMIIQSLKPG